MNSYLVVIHRPTPARPDLASHSWSAKQRYAVQHVKAETAQEAADKANVPHGGYAEVADMKDVERFDRAEKAPLVPRHKPDLATHETGH